MKKSSIGASLGGEKCGGRTAKKLVVALVTLVSQTKAVNRSYQLQRTCGAPDSDLGYNACTFCPKLLYKENGLRWRTHESGQRRDLPGSGVEKEGCILQYRVVEHERVVPEYKVERVEARLQRLRKRSPAQRLGQRLAI